MVLSDIDIMLLIYIDFQNHVNVNNMSRYFKIEKTNLYKSLNKLKSKNFLICNNDRPKQYSINTLEFDKWKKSK